MAETRQGAYRDFDECITTYQLKFPKSTTCLAKDRYPTEVLENPLGVEGLRNRSFTKPWIGWEAQLR